METNLVVVPVRGRAYCSHRRSASLTQPHHEPTRGLLVCAVREYQVLFTVFFSWVPILMLLFRTLTKLGMFRLIFPPLSLSHFLLFIRKGHSRGFHDRSIRHLGAALRTGRGAHASGGVSKRRPPGHGAGGVHHNLGGRPSRGRKERATDSSRSRYHDNSFYVLPASSRTTIVYLASKLASMRLSP